MPETAGVLERSGSAIHYWFAGPRRGPLLAFTHGTCMDHRMFEPQLRPVWGAGYRTVRWDVRGHGRSKPIGKLPLTVGDIADDLLALLDNLVAGSQFFLVGQSLGGHVAQELTFRHPERVAGLALIGCTCRTLQAAPWRAWARKLPPRVARLRSTSHLRHRVARSAAIVPDVQTYAFEAAERLSRSELLAVRRAAAGAAHPKPGYRIEQPLLLTHGEYDRTPGVAKEAPAWADRDPRCRYEVIPRAGHLAHQDNPTAFNRVLLEFLTEHYRLPRPVR
ncbi:alpha/beta fold hydrolase [Actinopolymorpha alba]|uniref:alpha/beta fold hydrolase n=1 Tax=Actinopolymorpha alba TaxID=533267 RepID=UPI0003A18648|nr:alpha/beta hydrolase [Actinopolymorpha alba]